MKNEKTSQCWKLLVRVQAPSIKSSWRMAWICSSRTVGFKLTSKFIGALKEVLVTSNYYINLWYSMHVYT